MQKSTFLTDHHVIIIIIITINIVIMNTIILIIVIDSDYIERLYRIYRRTHKLILKKTIFRDVSANHNWRNLIVLKETCFVYPYNDLTLFS